MYSNEIFTADKDNNAQMMTTVEIAEMMGMAHKHILRKLEGQEKEGKHIKGIIEILADAHLGESDSTKPQVGLSEFFIESTYEDASGKENKCYMCTRKGCELLAHKFQGEKGILFTIRYINRFHDMEEVIKQAQTQENEQPKITQKTSDTAIPTAPEWRMKNSSKIERLMRNMKLDRKGVYHEILLRVGDYYDLEAAKEIYKQERGFEPPYSMSIIEYFTDLQEYADKVIESLLFMNPDPKPFGWDW